MEGLWTPQEEAQVRAMTKTMVVGGPNRIRDGLQKLISQTGADELIITSDLHDDMDRLKSFEIIISSARSGE
jgi:alkanesulfonate monooxygenase SsuD/methylene tetrahydromethanopterin reductase-like flavin-dependent oxidoreductase (luciferase family)